MSTRRFLPPWSVEELDACFVVLDSGAQICCFVNPATSFPDLA
jgi:hypothetical protein